MRACLSSAGAGAQRQRPAQPEQKGSSCKRSAVALVAAAQQGQQAAAMQLAAAARQGLKGLPRQQAALLACSLTLLEVQGHG